MAQPKINLLYQFLDTYNINYKDIFVPVNQKPEPLFKIEPKHGDMFIYYQDLNGNLVQHNKKGKLTITARRRLANPFVNNDGQTVKYLMDGNNVIYYPPEMIAAYKSKTQIETLIVTEGEKKSFVACKNSFDCIGISGIWNFCEQLEDDTQLGGLLPSLKDFLRVCGVKKVVLLHDSDALDISTNKKKSATDRPTNFYKATRRFAELIFQEGVQFFYSYINPHLKDSEGEPLKEKLGLDDLIVKYETYHHKVLLDLHESVNANKKTTFFCTTQIPYLKDYFIKSIFQLHDAGEFYAYHKAAFKNVEEFRFENRTFKINHIENKIEEKKETGRESVWITEGKYIANTMNGSVKTVSNFTMNVLFLLKSHTNPKRIVEFKNVLGQSFIKELLMDDFVSVSAFRKKLIGDGSFIYKGDMYELLNLIEILFKEEKLASELTSLGWQKHHKFFAFSNGITSNGKFFPVDEYGIVTHHEERFYLPAYSNLFKEADEAFENERNFKHIVNDVTFEEWTTLFHKTYKKNGVVGILFGIATLFRDIIYGEFKEFPLLNMFGQKGSGKSTMAKSLMNLFGTPQSAISLENASSTKKGIYRKFSQFRNAIVWLDEYKNSVHPDVVGLLKNLFDGIGYERAQTSQDNRTHSSPVLSSTIISGQDMPTIDPALFTRVILLMFKNNAFLEDDQINYNKLKALEKTGITNITLQLLGLRDLVEENFLKEFKVWMAKLSEEFKYDDIPDRLLKNCAMILAPVAIFVQHEKIKLPFTMADAYAVITEVLKQHKTLLNDNQETSVFWEIVETLFDERVLSFESGDFRFIGDSLAIRYNRIFSAYTEKYRKMFGRTGLDKLTLSNYLKNDPSFLEIKKSMQFEGINTSAYIFKYAPLNINLERTKEVKEEPPKSEHKINEPATIVSNDLDDKPF